MQISKHNKLLYLCGTYHQRVI